MKRAGRKPGSLVRFTCRLCSRVELVRLGGSRIDAMAAAAARRLGEWLRTAHEGQPT